MYIHAYLNEELPYRWIGHTTVSDIPLITWPPIFPDLTPCNFFLWGYVKDTVYAPPIPKTLQELKEYIWAALGTIDSGILQNVWNKVDYRLDVCCADVVRL